MKYNIYIVDIEGGWKIIGENLSTLPAFIKYKKTERELVGTLDTVYMVEVGSQEQLNFK